MKANRAARMRHNDSALAGLVAGILMLGALVAFLAYFNATWVPTYVANKEAAHASDLSAAMQNYADTAEDRVARAVTQRSFQRTVALGVSGIPVIGAGASAGELAIETTPTLNVTLGATTIAVASGAVTLTSHTERFPNQTYRYALGAMETYQSEGAWVDLRNLLHAQRATGGTTAIQIQVLNITGGPQATAGNGDKAIVGTVTLASNNSYVAGAVSLNVTNLPGTAGAWRAAVNRTLTLDGLSGTTETLSGSCYVAANLGSASYCFPTGTNGASSLNVVLPRAAAGWTLAYGVVAAEVRG